MITDKNKKRVKTDPVLMNDIMAKPRSILNSMRSEHTDPNGSYTGVPEKNGEKPVQDADDL